MSGGWARRGVPRIRICPSKTRQAIAGGRAARMPTHRAPSVDAQPKAPPSKILHLLAYPFSAQHVAMFFERLTGRSSTSHEIAEMQKILDTALSESSRASRSEERSLELVDSLSPACKIL